MAVLRQHLEEAGFERVRTYIQSGNILLLSDLPKQLLSQRIHDLIKERIGADLAALVFLPEELQAWVDSLPFADDLDPSRIFFTMVLRLLAPAMVTIFLFIFVATWNNFLLPLMMVTNNEQLKPVTLGLYGMMSYFSPTYGAVLQGALFGVLPLMALFLFLQRYWQSGLAAGSVKG